ncbi:MAG: 3-oxoacyl-ACP reductase, partial [Solirubrobacteraceae bacterium]
MAAAGTRLRLGAATVLVTGATGGIGGARARAIAGRGARRGRTGRRQEPRARRGGELRAPALVAGLA